MLSRTTYKFLQRLNVRRWNYYVSCRLFSTYQAQTHFGIDYADCKAKFIANSNAICNQSNKHNQYEIPLMKLRPEDIHHDTNIDTSNELTIDVTILNENNTDTDHLILNIAGIHGAEGYTGSSIQNCFLHSLTLEPDKNIDTLPVIIMVHGLNPYGFQLGRRCNSNNVDLNRNLKTEQQWTTFLNDDPNFAGYVTFDHLFNPSVNTNIFLNAPLWKQYLYKKWFRHSYWFRAVYNAMKFGLPKLGSAVTAGQCHKQTGVFYVGNKIETEHIKLIEFISDRFKVNTHWRKQFNKITLMDIHTGVGTSGVDSLYSDRTDEFEKMKQLFPEHAKNNKIELLTDPDASNRSLMDDSLQGAFQFSTGFSQNYRGVFYKEMENDVDFIGIIQEFGTYHKMRVFQALREENAVYQTYLELLKSNRYRYDDVKLNEFRKYVKESHDFVTHVFYIDSDKWKTSVVERGMALLQTVLKR